jgi:DNA-binding PadR family transcriptional regulator
MTGGGVAYVILGALRAGPKSGYEIKQLVDKATRLFWAASYGQIYPELRRLRDEGLIAPVDGENGARRRVRYELTDGGRKALVDWLKTPAGSYELRDELLLKLFFADALEPADALALVRSFRAHRQSVLDRLRQIDAVPARAQAPFSAIVLEYGLELYEWATDWADRLEARLQEEATQEGVRG